MGKVRHLRVRLRASIVAVIATVVLCTTIALLAVVLSASVSEARAGAQRLFDEVAGHVRDGIDSQIAGVVDLASLGAAVPAARFPVSGDGSGHPALPFLERMLGDSPTVYAVYYGYEDGTFLQLINAGEHTRAITALGAPAGTTRALRSVQSLPGRRLQHWTFSGADGTVLGSRTEPDPEYDPRVRPWYTGSLAQDATILTEPYLFNSTGAPGLTASRRLQSGGGVIGVDLTLDSLAELAEERRPSARGGIVLMDGQGRLLAASSTLARYLGGVLPEPLDTIAEAGLPPVTGSWRVGGEEVLIYRGSWHDGSGHTIGIVVIAPLADFTGHLARLESMILVFTLLLLLAMVPLAFFLSRKLTGVLTALADDAGRVRNLDFSGTSPGGSHIEEFHQLAEGFHEMKGTLSSRTRELDQALQRLTRIVDLAIAMAVERDLSRLTELTLQGAKELAGADGGSLYLRTPEEKLEFRIVLNDTLGLQQGGTSSAGVTLPAVELRDAAGGENHHNVVSHAVHTGGTVNIPDAYDQSQFDFSGTREFDRRNGYVSRSLLTVPLRPRGGEVIGALQLLNAKDPDTGEIAGFAPETQRFVEALASVAATALYNRQLLDMQQRLFDAVIQFVAGAIDAKSVYTGAHCARVPEIALMLAEEAARVERGPLAGFAFRTEEEWREFRIGAWLHDCGKVTTPEYIVDKATKLETIYNRIHEVRNRFEILLRDARIRALESVRDGEDPLRAKDGLEKRERELQEDFAFIAECNTGGEYMAPEQMERIRTLAAQTWVRHFDDRLGLSWEESARFAAIPVRELPCVEPLLADRPEHVIPRPEAFYERYKGRGFTLKVPQDLYNKGEIHNLCIARGTLNDEERFKINEHIMQTIVMLECLPLPPDLRRIPEYAGAHHETLRGTGYPAGLGSDRLSIPARIMVIADVFEALTAADRPYKRPKKLSECIGILSDMKKRGDIDPDLFDLLLTSGLYHRYAATHLRPEQIDEVDVPRFVTPEGAARG